MAYRDYFHCSIHRHSFFDSKWRFKYAVDVLYVIYVRINIDSKATDIKSQTTAKTKPYCPRDTDRFSWALNINSKLC